MKQEDAEINDKCIHHAVTHLKQDSFLPKHGVSIMGTYMYWDLLINLHFLITDNKTMR